MATKESIMTRTVLEGDCIVWDRHINRSGYGSVWHNGKNQDVHRVSYELHHGPIPEGMHVMHKCDNRPCINPVHLKLGTRHENMMDMFLKDRHRAPFGVAHHNAKLTPEIASAIKARFVPYSRVDGSSALAREFSVSQAAVYSVISGGTWKRAA